MLQGERDAAACIRLLLARLQVLDLEGDPKAFEQAQILADELHLHAQFAREARAIEQSIHISPFIPMGMFGDVFEGQLPTLAGLLHRRGQ
jgi:hypothetical protein